MMIERTLVLIKPPYACSNTALGIKIAMRYVDSGLKIIDIENVPLKDDLFSFLYGEHKEKPFFGLMRAAYLNHYFTALCLEGEDAVSRVRKINGATDPRKAAPGTIRADFGDIAPRTDELTTPYNAVHASADLGCAERELQLFFPKL